MKQLKPLNGMRDVRALASDPTVDKVSGFKFRSEEEVQVFLDSLDQDLKNIRDRMSNMQKLFSRAEDQVPSMATLMETAAGGIKIDRTGTDPGPVTDLDDLGVGKIVIQNITKLRENFSLVTEISDKLDMLDTLEAQVMHAFRGERSNKIPAAVKATRAQYEKQLKTAMNFLKTVAKKHEPRKFKNMLESVLNFFHEGFKNKFRAAEEHIFVTTQEVKMADGQKHPCLVFNHYIQFTDLVNEHIDYTYPTYIVVFTAIVNESGKMMMYVNTLHKFRSPGSFKPGHAFKDVKTGVHALSNLFETDDFVDLLDRQPVPIPSGKMDTKKFRSQEFIKSADVEDNKVQILFNGKVNGKNVQDVAVNVFADVRGLLGPRITTNLRYKILPPAKGMEFILTLPTGTDTTKFLTQEKIDRLKEHLDFDDDDVAKLLKVFNKGHH